MDTIRHRGTSDGLPQHYSRRPSASRCGEKKGYGRCAAAVFPEPRRPSSDTEIPVWVWIKIVTCSDLPEFRDARRRTRPSRARGLDPHERPPDGDQTMSDEIRSAEEKKQDGTNGRINP